MNSPLPTIPYFISYTPTGDTLPDTFIQGLQSHFANSTQFQFQPWNSTGTLSATEINNTFFEALEACNLIILLLAPGYYGRNFLVSTDLTPFLSQNKIIFPIALKPINLSVQEARVLKQLQWFHLTHPKTRTPLYFRDCHTSIQREAFITHHGQAIEQRLLHPPTT